MRVAVVACAFAADVDDADALLDRYRGPNGWSDALAEAGATVAVVQRFRRSRVLRRGQVDFHFVADGAPPSPPARFWGGEVARAVRALGPDVVHVDGLVFPALVGNLRVTLPRRTAIVVQDHGGLADPRALFRTWPRRLLFAAGLRAADGFLFTSRQQAAPWQRAGVLGASQAIHEVPEGSVDRADLAGLAGLAAAPGHAVAPGLADVADAPGLAGAPGLGWAPGLGGPPPALPGRPALLWVGRLDANKDPLTVLRGFERAAPSMPESALTLVFGDDALLPEVRAAIAGSEVLRGRVHLRGRLPREALGALYAAADLFVLGSHHEAAGYALIEALSFGVTPVVADIAPFRRLTGDGRLGALFAPGDSAGLARALEGLARVDLAARRPAVRAHFDRELGWPVLGRKALEVYRAASRARASA